MLIKTDLSRKYIDLLKKSLINELYLDNEARIIYFIHALVNNKSVTLPDILNIKDNKDLMSLLKQAKSQGDTFQMYQNQDNGTAIPIEQLRNYTELSHSMIGRKRMDNLQYCMESVLNDNISGDFIETGIWRGGATIFMRGILQAYNITDRIIWAADSFKGVPPPTLPEDEGFDISAAVYPFLKVGIVQVWELFEQYDLLDEQVKFLKGWFKDTLPTAPIDRLAMLRLDGDLYESTMDALIPLYGKVSKGGFVIVDDYYSCLPCMRAIDDFRATNCINEQLIQIDNQSVYWRKENG